MRANREISEYLSLSRTLSADVESQSRYLAPAAVWEALTITRRAMDIIGDILQQVPATSKSPNPNSTTSNLIDASGYSLVAFEAVRDLACK
jgi:hypothetical protein